MLKLTTLIRLSLFASLALLADAAFAGAPAVSYVFPAGAQRGTEVRVRVGGFNLREACPWKWLGAGVRAPDKLVRTERIWFEGPVIPQPASQAAEDYPQDMTATLQIAADAQPGEQRFRVWTTEGAAPSHPFIIGDYPEVVETEVEGAPLPVQVELPVTINGRIFPREDQDHWTFAAHAGQPVTCEIVTSALLSPLQPRMVIRGPDGADIADAAEQGFSGRAQVRFVPPADGIYTVVIDDLEYGGLQNYVYRLTVTAGPWIDRVFPQGGQRGTTVKLALTGQHVPAVIDVPLPATGETFTLHWADAEGRVHPVTLDLGADTEFQEPAATEPITVPAVFNGQILQPGEQDAWPVTLEAGKAYRFDVLAQRLGSDLDSVLVITGPDGKELARADDLAGNNSDSRLDFTPPQPGVYHVRVQERFSRRSGPGFSYRLLACPVEKLAPDFRLTVVSDAFNVEREKAADIKVQVERLGGFAGEIELTADGLPAGLTAAPVKIAGNQNEGTLKIQTTADTKTDVATLTLNGTSKIGEEQVQRPVLLNQPRGMTPVASLVVGVSLPAPFKYHADYEAKYVPRGTVLHRHYTIDRGGYTGPLTVRLRDKQFRHLQGVTGPVLELAPDAKEFDYPVYLPPWMDIGRTSRSVVELVGVVTEADGTQRTVSFTSDAQETQIIAIVDPELLGVQLATSSLMAQRGQTVEIPVQLARHPRLGEVPVRLEVVIPEHMRGVTAETIEVGGAVNASVVQLRFADGPMGPWNAPLIVRATALPPGGDPVVSEARIEIVAPDDAPRK